MMINKERIKNNRILRHIYYFSNGILKREKLRQKAEKTIIEFGQVTSSETEKRKQIADMLHTYELLGYTFAEYMYFQFSERSMKERRAFVADWEHLGYTCAMNDSRNAELFDNKWKTYQRFKDFYRRDLLYIEEKESYAEYRSFLVNHKSSIIKPIDASCGHGVQLITCSSSDDVLETLFFNHLLEKYNGKFIMEELIVQSKEMGKFHPSSVNTIRVTTIRTDRDTLIIHPFMRMGQHGNHVDNGGAGGIMCTIDTQSGNIIAAADEFGRHFTIHPDTKEQIIGFRIPRFDELVSRAKELAQVVPENRYTGWDLALTDKGWVMVEANRRGQFVGWQIPTQIGFRDELNSIMQKIGCKY